MKRSRRVLILGVFLVVALITCAHAGHVGAETLYYAIEINDVLCGYSEVKTSPFEEDGKALILLEQRTKVRMRKTSVPAEIPQGVPEEFAPYLGTYLMAPLQTDFTVIFDDGSLARDQV